MEGGHLTLVLLQFSCFWACSDGEKARPSQGEKQLTIGGLLGSKERPYQVKRASRSKRRAQPTQERVVARPRGLVLKS
jgi:hypothetical protein